MSRFKANLRGGIAVFAAVLAGLALFSAPTHAQSSIAATIVPNGNSFQCVANGTNVTIKGPFWEWVAVIDGQWNGPYSQWGYNAGPNPYTGPWTLNILSVNAIVDSNLHGYHTCHFWCYVSNSWPTTLLWDVSAAHTFP